MSNAKRLPPRLPDATELALKAELVKGCPGCGSRTVSGKFRGRWEWTIHCKPECPSCTRQLEGFTGHTIGSEAAKRAGMAYWAIDGTTGGVVVAAQAD